MILKDIKSMSIKENTLALLFSLEDNKKFFIILKAGSVFSNHMGIIKHDGIMDKNFGDKIFL